ncbi:DNA-binding response regulator [Gorillibacterium sp. CAU 1737]|uniref:DNA-binding response regulator n=1 Tax=Gorillibacterium sp. CAU 1737 TaxID=3140362 RepID=UPI003261A8AE
MERMIEEWMELHSRGRSGESLRRLVEGHGHAERAFVQQVWLPAVGHLDHLVPEYEIHDFRDGVRYLDFAYLRPPYRVCLEVDGYGPHSRDLSRWQFADQLTRQNHLILDGWKVLRFSYDEVKERPRRCQQLIHQMLGNWYQDYDRKETWKALGLKQREILQRAAERDTFRIQDASDWTHTERQHARRLLLELCSKGYLEAASGNRRTTSYRLVRKGMDLLNV